MGRVFFTVRAMAPIATQAPVKRALVMIGSLLLLTGCQSSSRASTAPATATSASASSPAPTAPVTATSVASQGGTPSATSAGPSSAPGASGSPAGDWNVTYAASAMVTITLAGGTYTEFTKTSGMQIIPGVGCFLPSGTALATFTQTGPGTYAGNAKLWSENTCVTDSTTSMTLALSSDGNTLVATLTHSVGIPATLVFTRIQGTHQ